MASNHGGDDEDSVDVEFHSVDCAEMSSAER